MPLHMAVFVAGKMLASKLEQEKTPFWNDVAWLPRKVRFQQKYFRCLNELRMYTFGLHGGDFRVLCLPKQCNFCLVCLNQLFLVPRADLL